MQHDQLFRAMQSFPAALEGVIAGLSHEDAVWRPPDGAWSVLEIVRHLGDEEQVDFKARLRQTLEDPMQDWPGIDPESRVREMNFNAGALDDAFEQFRAERGRSIDWLRSLEHPDWSAAHTHPRLGSISAGELLAAWSAHDWLHLRQISKRRVQLIAAAADPYAIDYAGGQI